ncbi:Hypothetical predicted protein [Paramuricea clavata]|uniref:Uncharacterized protein n=1 Tax=Paramuricea clavata TaxID=317549 RepID=A0A7D9HEC0_PARCT|nr:Hypothetical predicted protein [Paramuricea clavata]
MEIRKQQASLERQLSALMKKEGKAEWFKKKSTKEITKSKDPAPDTQRKIPFLLKSNLSASSSTDDSHNTLTVCSDSSIENGRDSPPPCDESPVTSSEGKQDFPQVSPKITNQEEGKEIL